VSDVHHTITLYLIVKTYFFILLLQTATTFAPQAT